MSIDWFTFSIQIVNFLILVGLLRYFLYGPIVRAMQQREQKVTQRLTDADAAKTAAQQQRQQLEAETLSIQQQRDAMIARAKEEAESERQTLLSEARKEAENRSQQWEEAFERERRDLTEQTRRDIQRMGFDAARRTLQQIADTDLQTHLIDVFIRQLKTLDPQRREEVATQLTDSGNSVVIRSAIQIADLDRDRLCAALAEAFGSNATFQFETDDSLVCGLEVDAGGYSLRWNAAETMKQMEATMG